MVVQAKGHNGLYLVGSKASDDDGFRTCCSLCLPLLRNSVSNLNFEVVCNQDVYFLFSVALTTWMPCNWFVPVSVCWRRKHRDKSSSSHNTPAYGGEAEQSDKVAKSAELLGSQALLPTTFVTLDTLFTFPGSLFLNL